MNHHHFNIALLLTAFSIAWNRGFAEDPPNVDWGVQFGTSGADFPLEVESDVSGNVYVVGQTDGSFDGQNAGKRDGFLAKFNASGSREWVRHLGSASYDAVSGVTVWGENAVFVCGTTDGTLGAQKFGGLGDNDVFVARYDSQGNRIWLIQLGTNKIDIANRIAADPEGNCYVTGKTSGVFGSGNEGGEDVFVFKMDGEGNMKWITQFGSKQNEEECLRCRRWRRPFHCGIHAGRFRRGFAGQRGRLRGQTGFERCRGLEAPVRHLLAGKGQGRCRGSLRAGLRRRLDGRRHAGPSVRERGRFSHLF